MLQLTESISIHSSRRLLLLHILLLLLLFRLLSWLRGSASSITSTASSCTVSCRLCAASHTLPWPAETSSTPHMKALLSFNQHVTVTNV
jgi:hypothetical protein